MDLIQIGLDVRKEFEEEGTNSYDLFFNKLNGTYLGIVSSDGSAMDSGDDTFMWKRIPDLDVSKEGWVGTYEDGGVVDHSTQLDKISEIDIDKTAHSRIINKYDYYHQLNIISDALLAMGSNSKDLKEMSEFIRMVRTQNNANKMAYEKSDQFDYESKERMLKDLDHAFAGGLREVVGPWSGLKD